ncbi:MAG: sigma-54-dependent Fis family transcriptional regulator [Deltaproteobacteria bacterium HGW-Deltaproteobacteria-13]|jgi:two-component system response regulator HydG|nr:MAG: sigma-54-dependent Fis family transcriptional regulator [Deltaproteobacteria bacterium HGW-Deltaproteobacteria-13]
MSGRILIVDDDQSMCELIEADLSRRGFQISWYTSADEAFQAFQNKAFDVVLTDLQMPGIDGIDFCKRIVSNRPDIPVIVITAFGSMETAIRAMRAGAYDFVTKPVEMDILAMALERALKHRSLQEQVKTLSEVVEHTKKYDELIGASNPMQNIYNKLSRIADSESTVLITGESGTGKELVARILHKQSNRNAGPFVAINCAALTDTLLESELFGHTRGAFTDARSARKGLFLQADGGTLLLDEIGDIPLTLQPKLLRALEERSLRPVGGDTEVSFDVRVISTTNCDLESAIEEKLFREDLFFRINVIQIELPPLRQRGTDILLLAQHFIEHFAILTGKRVSGISDAVAGKLLDYAWPGNVRELRNVIERAVALTQYEKLIVEDLPEKIRSYHGTDMIISSNASELVSMEETERRYILHVLKVVGGNKAHAARLLGFDRKTLYRKLQFYKIAEDDKG